MKRDLGSYFFDMQTHWNTSGSLNKQNKAYWK